MKMYQFIKGSCIACTTALFLTACGGGGGGSSTGSSAASGGVSTPSASKAFFIDAPVGGVIYKNADNTTGITNSDGSFERKSGTTQFYIGDVKIGEINKVNSDNNVFIQDLVGVPRTNIKNEKVLKIATLLQTLDSDGDNTNGITLKTDDDKLKTFKSKANANNLDSLNLSTVFKDTGISLKEEVHVKNHLKTYLKRTAGVDADETAPRIISTNTNTNLKVSDNITLRFSEPLSISTLRDNIELKNASSSVVFTSISYDTSTNTVIINPNQDLSYGGSYTLTVKTGLKDASDNTLQSERTFSFTTNSLPDNTKPTASLNVRANLAINANIEVKFSEAMDKDTIKKENIVLKDNGNNTIASDVTYNETTFVASINPKENLNASSTYSINLKDDIKDLAGQNLEASSLEFTTINANLAQRLQISSSSLDSNSANLPVNSIFTLTFSKEFDQATLANNIILGRTGVNSLPIDLSVRGNTVTVTPRGSLLNNKNYTLTVKNGIKDTAGLSLDIDSNQVYNFSTAALVDNVKPKLVDSESSISNGSSGVAVDADLTFTFNEDMNPSTITSNGGIILQDRKGENVNINVTYNNRLVTIEPANNLDFASLYTLKLTKNITDSAGNKYDGNPGLLNDQDKLIKFVTAHNPSDSQAPSLISDTDLKTIAKDSSVVIEFNEEIKNITDSNKDTYIGENNKYFFEKYENRKIYFKPNSHNKYDTNYTIILKKAISDLAGNSLSDDITITLKTQVQNDKIAPVVSSSTPHIDGSLIGLDSNLTVTFDEELESSLINATNIKLVKKSQKDTNLLTNSNISYSTPTITIDPSSDLEDGVEYILILKYEGLSDKAGNKFKGNPFLVKKDYEIAFTARKNSCKDGYTSFNSKCYKIEAKVELTKDDKKNKVSIYSKVPSSCNLMSRKDIASKESDFARTFNLDKSKKYLLKLSDSSQQIYKLSYSFGRWNTIQSPTDGYPICKKK